MYTEGSNYFLHEVIPYSPAYRASGRDFTQISPKQARGRFSAQEGAWSRA